MTLTLSRFSDARCWSGHTNQFDSCELLCGAAKLFTMHNKDVLKAAATAMAVATVFFVTCCVVDNLLTRWMNLIAAMHGNLDEIDGLLQELHRRRGEGLGDGEAHGEVDVQEEDYHSADEDPQPVPAVQDGDPQPVPAVQDEDPQPVPAVQDEDPQPVPAIRDEGPRPVPDVHGEDPPWAPVLDFQVEDFHDVLDYEDLELMSNPESDGGRNRRRALFLSWFVITTTAVCAIYCFNSGRDRSMHA